MGAALGLSEARARLMRGEAVTFPTDTVAGVGISPFHAPAPDVLYRIKGRPADKPISWLVGCVDDLERFGWEVPRSALSLAHAFWPGPLTLVVAAAPCVPAPFASRSGTIGLRMPDHPVPLALMGPAGISGPLAATSANPSGRPDAADASRIDEGIRAHAPLVAGSAATMAQPPSSCGHGIASTVVDCTGPAPRILRAGSISAADVEAALV